MLSFFQLIGIGGALIMISALSKAAHGYFITNILTTDITLRRTLSAGSTTGCGSHDLVTVIKLKKGAVNALRLLSLKVEVFEIGGKASNENFAEWRLRSNRPADDHWVPDPDDRSISISGKRVSESYIFAIWTLEKGRPLNLAPSEETQYASFCKVECDQICEVVVTLLGERYKSPFAKGAAAPVYPVRLNMHRFGVWSLHKLGLLNWEPKEPPQFAKVYWTASAISVPADAPTGKEEVRP